MLEGSCHCGAVRWRFDAAPASATACNCTVCRRYGALWAYGHADEDVFLWGETHTYVCGSGWLGFHFCLTCGNMAAWQAVGSDPEGRRRMAVNLRLTEPETVAHLPVDRFDGLHGFTGLPRDGRTVADLWF